MIDSGWCGDSLFHVTGSPIYTGSWADLPLLGEQRCSMYTLDHKQYNKEELREPNV